MSDPIPGWYPDPEEPSRQRFWDGTRWTDARAYPIPAAMDGTPGAGEDAPKKGPSTALIVLLVLLVVALVIAGVLFATGFFSGGSSEPVVPTPQPTTPTETPTEPTRPPISPSIPTPTIPTPTLPTEVPSP